MGEGEVDRGGTAGEGGGRGNVATFSRRFCSTTLCFSFRSGIPSAKFSANDLVPGNEISEDQHAARNSSWMT